MGTKAATPDGAVITPASPFRCSVADSQGTEVPTRFVSVFEARWALSRAANELEAFVARLAQLAEAPGGRDLDVGAIRKQVAALQLAILRGMPDRLCRCGDPKCELCGGDGWTSMQRILDVTGSLPGATYEAA